MEVSGRGRGGSCPCGVQKCPPAPSFSLGCMGGGVPSPHPRLVPSPASAPSCSQCRALEPLTSAGVPSPERLIHSRAGGAAGSPAPANLGIVCQEAHTQPTCLRQSLPSTHQLSPDVPLHGSGLFLSGPQRMRPCWFPPRTFPRVGHLLWLQCQSSVLP